MSTAPYTKKTYNCSILAFTSPNTSTILLDILFFLFISHILEGRLLCCDNLSCSFSVKHQTHPSNSLSLCLSPSFRVPCLLNSKACFMDLSVDLSYPRSNSESYMRKLFLIPHPRGLPGSQETPPSFRCIFISGLWTNTYGTRLTTESLSPFKLEPNHTIGWLFYYIYIFYLFRWPVGCLTCSCTWRPLY